MMDPLSVTRLSFLQPTIRGLGEQLLQKFENPFLRVTQGLRDWKAQATLFAQGRTTPGAIVTDAPPGYSWHEFGLAFDLAPITALGPDWNTDHPIWKQIIIAGEALGLYSGSHFGEGSIKPRPDDPHFQLTGRFPASPTDEVRALFAQGNLQAVWDAAGIGAQP